MNPSTRCQLMCNQLPTLLEAGTYQVLRPHRHIDRVADFHVLIFILEGGMKIYEEGICHTLTPGSLFILKSGCHHWGEEPFLINTKWHYFHFKTQHLPYNATRLQIDSTYDLLETRDESALFHFVDLPKLLQLTPLHPFEKDLRQIVTSFKKSHGLELIQLHMAFFDLLLKLWVYTDQINLPNASKIRIDSIIDFLNKNYTRNFNSDELTSLLGLTYKHLSSLFKTEVDITIKAYQIKLRMQHAIHLLTTTHLSISEVANSLGYYDAFYFSRQFNAYYSQSPTHYRKNHIPRL